MSAPSRDTAAGLSLMVIGALALVLVWHLPHGSLVAMGPAFLPNCLGSLLILMGAGQAVAGLLKGAERLNLPGLRPLLLVPGALLAFGLVMPWAGMIPAIIVTIGVATFAGVERRWSEVALATTAVILLCVGLFRYALNIPLPLVLP